MGCRKFAVLPVVVLIGLSVFGCSTGDGAENDRSRTTAKVTVPDLVGLTEARAKDTLSEAGLRIEVLTEPAASVADGQVIATDPSAGEQVEGGSVVTVRVAKQGK